jgi:hypothetical protein
MNIARLRQLNARFQEIAKALDAELAEPESAKEPLCVHIYHSRCRYRKTMEADTSKSGRRVQEVLDESFKAARDLGFQGGSREWFIVMMSGTLGS